MAITQNPQIKIRKANPKDASKIAELGSHVFAVTFGHSVAPQELQSYLSENYSFSEMENDISNPQKDMIVATTTNTTTTTNADDDEILGFALMTRGTTEPCIAHIPKQVELQRIYVHPSAHGGGVGKLLALTLEDMAREQGFGTMWLGVWEENLKALKVYERLGYERVGAHDFRIGDVVQTNYIMIKSI